VPAAWATNLPPHPCSMSKTLYIEPLCLMCFETVLVWLEDPQTESVIEQKVMQQLNLLSKQLDTYNFLRGK